jgi:hypothetical protein
MPTLTESIDGAVREFGCFWSDQILNNPLRFFPPMLLLVPQAQAIKRTPGYCSGALPPSSGLGNGPRGGQCVTAYDIVFDAFNNGSFWSTGNIPNVQGPITEARLGSVPNGPGVFLLGVWYATATTPRQFFSVGVSQNSAGLPWSLANLRIVRRDGQPDSCGNLPPEFKPDPRPTPAPPEPPPTVINVTNNYNTTINYNYEGDTNNYSLDLSFGPIVLAPVLTFPITIPVSISGSVKIGDVKIDFDGLPTFAPNRPSGGTPEPPECPDTTTIVVPFAIRESCSQSSAELEVLTDSLPPALVGRLIDTVNLALESCGEDPRPIQEPEELLSSGTAPNPAGEQFVAVPDECVSVRLRITSPGSARQVTTYGTAGQRKYGSLGFAMTNMNGGGDYVYVYDQETYYPLPPRGKPGRVRLLLAPGVGWQLYDTGERL